tara:strand:+ start:12362 stop:12808 length:447 start_codon:yes stop_codon:yes gene_type:complete
MIAKKLKALFETPVRESEGDLQHRLNLAAAALLIETARADFTQDMEEQKTLEELLISSLSLGPQEVSDLVAQASDRVDEAVSLYDFTRVINDHYSAQKKLKLIDAMWTVAYADGDLDKYEEHLIRKVAELTYVPHQDYIQSKLSAANA